MMMQEQLYPNWFARFGVKRTFDGIDPNMTKVFMSWALRHPRYLLGAYRLTKGFKATSRSRKRAHDEGLVVPPFLILSITSSCNLRCAGCFATTTGISCNGTSSKGNGGKSNLSVDEWRGIIQEASDLGVYGFILAGGEPFLFPGLLDLCEEFKDRFFIIFSNGTAISETDYKRLKRSTNIGVVISIEGSREMTDNRRGPGVYNIAMATLQRLSKIGVPNGIAVTVTRMNHKYWTDPKNIDELIKCGVRIGVFLEFIPQAPNDTLGESLMRAHFDWASANDRELMLTQEERRIFRQVMLSYREKKSIYIIHSPGDEDFFGGCVSAGRGFAHITPNGDVTPCPVSNIATHNLCNSSLREALASPLFIQIRENDHLLETDDSPCALFAHPDEVEELVKNVGAYRTGS